MPPNLCNAPNAAHICPLCQSSCRVSPTWPVLKPARSSPSPRPGRQRKAVPRPHRHSAAPRRAGRKRIDTLAAHIHQTLRILSYGSPLGSKTPWGARSTRCWRLWPPNAPTPTTSPPLPPRHSPNTPTTRSSPTSRPGRPHRRRVLAEIGDDRTRFTDVCQRNSVAGVTIQSSRLLWESKRVIATNTAGSTQHRRGLLSPDVVTPRPRSAAQGFPHSSIVNYGPAVRARPPAVGRSDRAVVAPRPAIMTDDYR